MTVGVYIRPLRESDARISCHWRNDPEVWRFTGSRPDRDITEEIELAWIRGAIADEGARRFAICVKETDEYVGNVQLTNIDGTSAEFHIFIGNRAYWGKGISTAATRLVLEFARATAKLKTVYLHVRKENVAAIRSYEKNGFRALISKDNDIRMEVELT